MVLSYLVGQRKSPVPYRILPLAGYFGLALGLYGVSVWLRPEGAVWQLVLNTLLLLVYVGVVMYNERELVKGVLRRVVSRKK